MKNILLTTLIYLSSVYMVNAQKKTKNMHNDIIIDKWIKATINIEGRPNFTDTKEYQGMTKKYFDKIITQDEYVAYITRAAREVSRFTGTAIFFKYNNKHYLITARHVLENTNPPIYNNSDTDRVFDIIMLIANGSSLIEGNTVQHDIQSNDNILLTNYNTGTDYGRPFAFSSKDDDLAILKIDHNEFPDGKGFVSTLLKRGYIPIEISDIDTKCDLVKGQEIMALGFTGDGSVIDQKNLSPAEFNWESDLITLPIVSEGIVANNQSGSNTFSGNIFVYKGNSGGPIISNGKLVGIVSNSTLPIVKTSTSTLNYYRSRNINFIKSSLILPMLEDLEIRLADPWKYMSQKEMEKQKKLIPVRAPSKK